MSACQQSNERTPRQLSSQNDPVCLSVFCPPLRHFFPICCAPLLEGMSIFPPPVQHDPQLQRPVFERLTLSTKNLLHQSTLLDGVLVLINNSPSMPASSASLGKVLRTRPYPSPILLKQHSCILLKCLESLRHRTAFEKTQLPVVLA